VKDVQTGVPDAVIGFVAGLTGRPLTDFESARSAGDDWLGVLRQWLAREKGYGLVSIANPAGFSWPGHWIAVVDDPESPGGEAAVLLFGSPSAVIESPDAPRLVGTGVEDLEFRDALILVPFDPFEQSESQRPAAAGQVTGIYIARAKTQPMISVSSAKAIAGKGLEGDRYAAKAGTFTPRTDRLRGYDLTLVASEVLEEKHLEHEESRRNVVTSGIDLNALVGREFRIGAVRAYGQRLCEPCVHLQRLTRPGIVAALVHKGGLRADVLSDGEIHVGDAIVADR
jgi:MOSC domain-containing protein YiiM